MKIQYNGTTPVDIPGHDEVAPGQVVEVADWVGETLLTAGHSYDPNGALVAAPDSALWTLPTRKTAPVAASPAEPGKEG